MEIQPQQGSAAASSPGRPSRQPSLGRRFLVAYVVLGVAVLAAAAVGIYFGLVRSNKVTPWSTWKPTSSDLQTGLTQISGHVSQRYRLANGQPQASIHFSSVQINQQQVQAIGLAKTPKAPPGFLTSTRQGDSVLFQLCGVGGGCPSVQNGALTNLASYTLRQEGFELALYALKYLPQIQTVVVVFGQKPFDPQQLAEVYLRPALEQQKLLSVPLAKALAVEPPPAAQKVTPAERQRIVARAGHLYEWTLANSPTGLAMIITPAPEPK